MNDDRTPLVQQLTLFPSMMMTAELEHGSAPAAGMPRPRVTGMVAIVDDDPQISRALGVWLDLHALRASHHIAGESLLQVIRLQDGKPVMQIGVSNPVSFPLVGVVLDLNLPGINGIELARTLRRLAPTLPLVIVTALGNEDRRPYGPLPSGVCCLKKPFELDELEAALFPQPRPETRA